MNFLRALHRRVDLFVVVAIIYLSAAGLAAVYSATRGGDLFYKQLMWVGIGWGVFAAALIIPYRITIRWAWVFYLLTLAALAVLAVRAVAIGGAAHRWLDIGPLRFQPSEIAKVATVITLAWLLDLEPFRRLDRIPNFIAPIAIAALPAALVAVEPDLGTSLVFVPILFACLYWAGAPLPQLLLLGTPAVAMIMSFKLAPFLIFLAVAALVAVFARAAWWERAILFIFNLAAGVATPLFWGLLKEYQKQRIMTFLAPSADPRGAGYSTIQAKIALGSGQLFGKGFLEGSQVHLKFLPAGHTDFVLPTFGEEFGFLGCALVVAMFAVLVWRAFVIAAHAADRRGSILAFGLGALFLFQFAVNAAMAVGLLPVAGIPLPFMSYGGTVTLTSFLAAALILNVKLRRERVAHDLKIRGYY